MFEKTISYNICLSCKKKRLSEEILVSWVSEWLIIVFNLTPFASYVSFIYLSGSRFVFGIRILKGPEYGFHYDRGSL